MLLHFHSKAKFVLCIWHSRRTAAPGEELGGKCFAQGHYNYMDKGIEPNIFQSQDSCATDLLEDDYCSDLQVKSE